MLAVKKSVLSPSGAYCPITGMIRAVLFNVLLVLKSVDNQTDLTILL